MLTKLNIEKAVLNTSIMVHIRLKCQMWTVYIVKLNITDDPDIHGVLLQNKNTFI